MGERVKSEASATTSGLAALLDLEVLDRDLFRGENEEGAGARMSLYGGQVRHSDSLWVRASSPLPDDPLVHACAVAYVSDLGSGFGQVEVPNLSAGGPSIDHSLWFHDPIRADEWMLLELWPLKASGSRGVYSGSLRSEAGNLGALLTQEMLLRNRVLDPVMIRHIAEYLGVTPE